MGRGKNRRDCNATPVASLDAGITDDAMPSWRDASDGHAVPYDAIRTILDYLWDDECEDYESLLSAGENVKGHVFLSLKALSKWLSRVE